MALSPKIYPTLDLSTGMTLRIDDITGNYTALNTGGYGAPNTPITSVTRVRFLVSSFLTEAAASNVTECVPSVEYEVTGSGVDPVEVDNKEFLLGDRFILEVDATPTIPDGLYVTQTGRYAVITDFLPADQYTELNPALIGIDSTTFPDSAYQATYELYTTEYLEGATFQAGTYIVAGTSLDVIEVASTGFRYNVGEVFTVDGSDTFTDISGTNTINLLDSQVTQDFPLYYDAWVLYNLIEQEYVNDACCNKPCLEQKLFKMNTLFEAVKINYQDELSLDDSGTQGLLDEIINIGNQNCS